MRTSLVILVAVLACAACLSFAASEVEAHPHHGSISHATHSAHSSRASHSPRSSSRKPTHHHTTTVHSSASSKKRGSSKKPRNSSKKGSSKSNSHSSSSKNRKPTPAPSHHRAPVLVIQDDPTFKDPTLGPIAIQKAVALGAKRMRVGVNWADWAPCRGQAAIDASVDAYRRQVTLAVSHGMSVHITFSGIAVAWGAPSNPAGQTCAPAPGQNPNPSEYAAWTKAQTAYFYGLGARYFSFWNEPNLSTFLCAGHIETNGDVDHANSVKCSGTGEETHALYVRLWEASYAHVKAERKAGRLKGAQFFVGEVASIGAPFEFLKKLKNIEADGFSIHPYQFCTPPNTKLPHVIAGSPTCTTTYGAGGGMAWLGQYQDYLRTSKEVRTPSGGVPELHLTEFGYRRDRTMAIPENYRAEWFVQALEQARNVGAASIVQYMLRDAGDNPQTWDSGLMDPAWNPLPIYTAIQQWVQKNH